MKLYLIIFFVMTTPYLCQILDFINTENGQKNQNKATMKILEAFENKSIREYFKIFHFVFNKNKFYELDSQESFKREIIFEKNVNKIKEHNEKNLSWKEGVNFFADYTEEEVEKYFLMSEADRKHEEKWLRDHREDIGVKTEGKINNNLNSFPTEEIDYTRFQKPPRAQGFNCGSCWAFTVASTIETNYVKSGLKNAPFYLSPQYLVSCNTNDDGCSGGNPFYTYDYIIENGIIEESSFTYKESKVPCNYPSSAQKYYINDYKVSWESSIENWHGKFKLGAMYVRVNANRLIRYKSGIFDFTKLIGFSCDMSNHALTTTAWKINTMNNKPYIKLRNSWGTNWGESGYIRIYYTPEFNETCFITKYSLVPIVN